MFWAGAIYEWGGADVERSGGLLDVHLQIRVRGAQAPVRQRPPLRSEFYPLRSSCQPVSKIGGEKNVRWSGICFHKRRAGHIFAKEIAIVIEKCGEIKIDRLIQKQAVARLIAI